MIICRATNRHILFDKHIKFENNLIKTQKDTNTLMDSKNGAKTYVIYCDGPCKDITVKMKASSGDPDLYGREGSPPRIISSDCNDCPECKSRSGSGSTDKCTITIGNSHNQYID